MKPRRREPRSHYESDRIKYAVGDFKLAESPSYKYLTDRFGRITRRMANDLSKIILEQLGLKIGRTSGRNLKVFFKTLDDHYESLRQCIFPYLVIVDRTPPKSRIGVGEPVMKREESRMLVMDTDSDSLLGLEDSDLLIQ